VGHEKVARVRSIA